jgi:hypothetical protein
MAKDDKSDRRDPMRKVVNRAYVRDGDKIYTGEALLIACLLHTGATSRSSKDMTVLREIMKDHNLDAPKNRKES